MSASALESWALPRLAKLLPLDDESLKQVIQYTSSLSKDESAEHLRNLLDDSPASLEFISAFNTRRGPQGDNGRGRFTADEDGGTSSGGGNKGQMKKKGGKKTQRGLLHTPSAPRRPEGYGDMSGGYVKPEQEGDYVPGGNAGRARGAFKASNISSNPASSADSSRNQSPAPSGKARAPPSASGPLISEYMPNVRSKKAPKSSSTTIAASSQFTTPSSASTSTTPTTTTTNNIADLTSAIAALEVSTNPKDKKQRKCACGGSLHPLFLPAPNCLSCGKIICALEGLQPCSFCGARLLSATEVQDMIQELRAERGNEKMRAHNDSFRRDDGPAPSRSKNTEAVSSKLDAAKAHRDKLLAFQAHNAQRTRVLDEAADFDIPNSSSTQWMSPAQRALALKKQQRNLREIEEQSRPEWEKRSMVMNLDIKGGKVIKTFGQAKVNDTAEDEEGEEDIDTPEDQGGAGAGGDEENGAFSNNPLLKGTGLVRPVWKASVEGKDGVPTRKREQKQTWRRVQDDNDDNEQWILDGGLHGYEQEVGNS